MNREDFENMVSQYLKPNNYDLDKDKIRSDGELIRTPHLIKNGELYAIADKGGWTLAYSLEDKQYYYNGGARGRSGGELRKGWKMDGLGSLMDTKYVERDYPFSRMNDGKGWNLFRNKGYLLSLHFISSFINWPNENPLEDKNL